MAWKSKGRGWGHEKSQNYHSELDNGCYPWPLMETLKPYRVWPICLTSHSSCSLLPINRLAVLNWAYVACGVSSRWHLYPWPHLTSLEGDPLISMIWMKQQVHRYLTTWPWPHSHQCQGEDLVLGHSYPWEHLPKVELWGWLFIFINLFVQALSTERRLC